MSVSVPSGWATDIVTKTNRVEARRRRVENNMMLVKVIEGCDVRCEYVSVRNDQRC